MFENLFRKTDNPHLYMCACERMYMLCQCSDISQCNHSKQSNIVESVNNKNESTRISSFYTYETGRKQPIFANLSLSIKSHSTMVYINRGKIQYLVCILGKNTFYTDFTFFVALDGTVHNAQPWSLTKVSGIFYGLFLGIGLL